MKRVLLILALGALLAGCRGEPEVVVSVNANFKVGKLFTHDGCTVYRFYDGGNPRYYSKCPGADSSVTFSESCGKNCTRHHDIPTSRVPE